MDISGALKKFRSGPEEESEEKSSGPRMIKLTDEEKKSLEGYGQPGEEIECTVRGRLGENGEFSVSSVSAPGGEGDDEGKMASEVMGKIEGPPPTMRTQTMPYPS